MFGSPSLLHHWIGPCNGEVVAKLSLGSLDSQIWVKAGTYQQLEFWLNGRQVGREAGRDGAPYWVAVTGNDERRVRVRLYLHQLVFYLAKGYTGLPQIPHGQSRVIIHLGECKGCCCCPWHFKLGEKSENSLTANQFRKWRGRHAREYKELPKGYELPNL